MDNKALDQIAKLEQKNTELPIGSVTKKTVNDHVYYYLRGSRKWMPSGKAFF